MLAVVTDLEERETAGRRDEEDTWLMTFLLLDVREGKLLLDIIVRGPSDYACRVRLSPPSYPALDLRFDRGIDHGIDREGRAFRRTV